MNNESTDSMPAVAVVIPAFNESRTIRDVAQRALNYTSRLIVVDDGSSDGTAAEIDDLPLTLIRQESNQGKAAALWRGMEAALDLGVAAVITLDADGQHRPEDIPRFLAVFNNHPHALVAGSRLHQRRNIPAKRYWANRFANFWISWAAGYPIPDSQTGFRLYPARLLQEVALDTGRPHGFVFESEILIEAGWRDYPLLAIPISAIYEDNARPSHFRSVADIGLITKMVAGRLLVRRMHPRGLYRGVIAPILKKHERRGLDGDGLFTLILSLVSMYLTAGLSYAWCLLRVLNTAHDTPATVYGVDWLIVPGHRLENGLLSEDYRRRLQRAAALYVSNGSLPRIIVTGAAGEDGVSEAEAGRDYLVEAGVPGATILLEDFSTNTLENLRRARDLLPASSEIVLVSNRYHLHRLHVLAEGLGIDAKLCAAEVRYRPSRCWRELFTEAFYVHWYWSGRVFAKITGNTRMLERIS